MEYFYEYESELQVGLDEAGRGTLIGPVFAAAVIWDPKLKNEITAKIKDSKKLSKKVREELRKYIEENAIAYSVKYTENYDIDEINILQATYKSMHDCLREIKNIKKINYDRILVDGDRFKPFACDVYNCITDGDNKYISIAAASILAKTYHDEWIHNLCNENSSLDDMFKLRSNMGYATKQHREGLEKYGITEYHRKTFCKKYL